MDLFYIDQDGIMNDSRFNDPATRSLIEFKAGKMDKLLPKSVTINFGHEKTSKTVVRPLPANMIAFAVEGFWLLLPWMPRIQGVTALWTDPFGYAVREDYLRNIFKRLGVQFFGYPILPSQVRRAVITAIAEHFAKFGTIEAFRLGIWIAARLSNTSVQTAEINYLLLNLEYDLAIMFMELWVSPLRRNEPLTPALRAQIEDLRRQVREKHVSSFSGQHAGVSAVTPSTAGPPATPQGTSSSSTTSSSTGIVVEDVEDEVETPFISVAMISASQSGISPSVWKLTAIKHVRFDEQCSVSFVKCLFGNGHLKTWVPWDDRFLETKLFWDWLEKEARAMVAWNQFPFNMLATKKRGHDASLRIMHLPRGYNQLFSDGIHADPPEKTQRVRYGWTRWSTLEDGFHSWLQLNVAQVPQDPSQRTALHEHWIKESAQANVVKVNSSASTWLGQQVIDADLIAWDDPTLAKAPSKKIKFNWDTWIDIVAKLKGTLPAHGKWEKYRDQLLYQPPLQYTQRSLGDFFRHSSSSIADDEDVDDNVEDLDEYVDEDEEIEEIEDANRFLSK